MSEQSLGTLTSTSIVRIGSVTAADQTDVFKFKVNGFKNVNLALDFITGDTDLKLFRDGNGNGQLDAADEAIALGASSQFQRISGFDAVVRCLCCLL